MLAKNPSHVGALVNRGNTLLRFNRPADAILNYDKALAAMPGHPQILTNRGHALRRLDRPVEALADFEAALVAGPEFPEAHFEAAMTRLTLGDFDAGWRAYEWRWKTAAFAGQRRQLRAPLWLGDAPVSGKTILLHAEQGFGDTIQFIRYAPLLASRGAKVVCEVQPELLSLLSRFEGIDIIAQGEPLPPFDLHCPLLSLPLAFGTSPRRSRRPFPISRRPWNAWHIGAIVCRKVGRAPDLSGPDRRRTRMTATGRSRSPGWPRCLKIRRSAASAFKRPARGG